MRKWLFGAGLVAACAATSSNSRANGFFVYEVSPSGMAQGGALIADASEPSTLFFNPAGAARLKGLQVQVSAYSYFTAGAYKSPAGVSESLAPGFFPVGSAFVTWKPHDYVAVGVGAYAAYGLGVNWPERWSGYHLIKKADLKSFTVQPSVAFGPFEGFTLGAGLDVLFGSVEIARGLQLGGNETGFSKLGGSSSALGFNVGAQYEPAKWLRLGAHFRSSLKVELGEGKADFTVPAAFDALLRDQGMRTGIKTPAIVGLGARVAFTPKARAELDVLYVGWSSFKELAFHFDNPALDQVDSRDWKDAMQLRAGGEYDINDATLRAGVLFDQNPIPDNRVDPLLPDTNRLGFSVGGGYKFGRFRVDGSYMFVYGLPREVKAPENAFPGTYTAHSHVFSVGGGAQF